MKLNKILASFVVISMFMAAGHQALSQTAKKAKTTSKKVAKKKFAAKNKTQEVSKSQVKTPSGSPAQQVQVMSDTSSPSTRVVVRTRTIVKETKSPVNGNLVLSLGKDSNLDPERKNINDTFFQIAPTINYGAKYIDFSFGGSSTDFSNSDNSNLYSNSEANASVALKLNITSSVLSTTTLSGKYNSARSTNQLEGLTDNDVDLGMSNRFAEGKISEALKLTSGSVTSEIGGFFNYHNALTKERDNAGASAGEDRVYERDTKEYGATGKVSVKATSYLTLSAAPKITQTKYDELVARESDGKRPIVNPAITDPKEDLIKTEMNLDAKFNILGSSITPKVVIGQTADQVRGARDSDFLGSGIDAEIVLNKDNELKLAPSFMYKRTDYDNWTNAIAVGEKNNRVDYNISTGVTASMKFSKNVGAGISYSKTEVRSNLPDPTLNYEKEVASTAITISF